MLDYTQTRLAGPTIGLYTCFGFLASVADTLLMWLISQLSGDYAVTARNVSIFRGFQAFGCAVSWVLIDNVSLVGNCLINWGLVVLCLPPLAYISIAIHRSSEQTDFDVDMQFSDLQADRDSCKFRSEYSTASV
ncbi:hypothetical protein GGI12_002873 [Dipsacomyces acuminosporus]|nr:hypothetical protein GGI12_002873 [Dipsacomyces acuminosporus]